MSEKGRDNDGRTTGQSEKEIGEPIRREVDVRRREEASRAGRDELQGKKSEKKIIERKIERSS